MKKKLCTAFALMLGLSLVSCNKGGEVNTPDTPSASQKELFDVLSGIIDEQNSYNGDFTKIETSYSEATDKLFNKDGVEIVGDEYKKITEDSYKKDPVIEKSKEISTYDKANHKYLEKNYTIDDKDQLIEDYSTKYLYDEGDTSYMYSVIGMTEAEEKKLISNLYKVSNDHIEHEYFFKFSNFFDGVLSFESLDAYNERLNLVILELAEGDGEASTEITQEKGEYTLTTNVSLNKFSLFGLGEEIKTNKVNFELIINYNDSLIHGLSLGGLMDLSMDLSYNNETYTKNTISKGKTEVSYKKVFDNNLKLSADELKDLNNLKQGEIKPNYAITDYISDQIYNYHFSDSSNFGTKLNGVDLEELEHVNVKYYTDKEKTKEIVIKNTEQPSYDQELYIDVSVDDGFALVYSYEDAPGVSDCIKVEVINVNETPTITFRTTVGKSWMADVTGKPFDYIELNDKKVTDANFKVENKQIYSVLYYYRRK